MVVFSNTKHADLIKKLSAPKKDYQELADIYSGLLIGTLPGDFYD
jgi:hypothetical protein